MTRAAQITRRASARFLSLVAVAAFTASAFAAPIDPNHRFEHVGRAVSDAGATLAMPTLGRALILEHDGDIHLTTGDRLVDDVIYHVDVSQAYVNEGLLDGAWDIDSPGEILYITYIKPSPRKLAVARLILDEGAVSQFDELYSVTIPPTASTNLGGGIAMAVDRTLFVGVGDMGTSTNAQRPTTLSGKIFRLNSDPALGAIPSDNPISATSPVYATGVRNPMRFITDASSLQTYFIDIGPTGDKDELNYVSRGANYAWDRYTGRVASTGFTDPVYTWSPAISPDGLALNDGANFGTSAFHNIFVTTTAGRISRLSMNLPPALATETVLFNSGGGEPASWTDIAIRPDGYAYLTDPGGDVWRLRSEAAQMEEPSDAVSITPLLVRKLSGGQLEFSVERETALQTYGLYVGDIRQSWINGRSNWYSHPLISTDLHSVDGNRTDAKSVFTTNMTGLPTVSYFLVSGINTREETHVGFDSAGVRRPGGMQTFGCPCPATAGIGPAPGQCAPEFTLAQGVQGQSAPGVYNYIGPNAFFADWDCDVILLDISMEWCGPCRAQASTANDLYESYAGQPFKAIHILPEDSAGNPSDIHVAERWTRDFGLTFPVFPDQVDHVIWALYDRDGFIPQTWLIAKDGTVAQHYIGLQSDATLHAAIDAELAR